MEYTHTIKKYTVLLTTEEVMEVITSRFCMMQFAAVSVGVMKNSPHIFTKILNGGKLVLKNRGHSSKWERNNPFPIFFWNFYLDVLRFLEFYLDVLRLNKIKLSIDFLTLV